MNTLAARQSPTIQAAMLRLRQYREERQITQTEAAIRADMNPADWSGNENGLRPVSLDMLGRMAGVLGLEIDIRFNEAQP